MKPSKLLILAATLGLLAACNAPSGPAASSSVRQDSGIGATGSAGMSGGAAHP